MIIVKVLALLQILLGTMNRELTNTNPDPRSMNFGRIMLVRLTPKQGKEWTSHRGEMHHITKEGK
jgi:hypothetical protein